MDLPEFLDEFNISPVPAHANGLSPKQIQQISAKVIELLQTHGFITVSLLNWMREQHFTGMVNNKTPTSVTPLDRPSLLCYDKMSSSTAQHHRVTIPQLYRYMGFRKPRDWKEIVELSQDTVTLAADVGEIPLELGDVANIKRYGEIKLLFHAPQSFWMLFTWTLAMGIVKQLVVLSIVYC
jgi:hypothetical protein